MKRNMFIFSLFIPLKVADELEIESLGWVHGSELDGGETGINPYKHRDCTVTARFKTYGNLNEKKD